MTPEAAVTRLVELVAARGTFSEDDIYAAMADAGIPDPVADRAYKFTQTAWGRAFLDGLGVHFGSEYLCFDAAGGVIESGELAAQPYYAAAVGLVRKYAGSPGFQSFALMSADVSTVNNALNAGARPENLVMGPAAFFLEPPTPGGMEKARQLLSERASASRRSVARPASPATKKPWWQFW